MVYILSYPLYMLFSVHLVKNVLRVCVCRDLWDTVRILVIQHIFENMLAKIKVRLHGASSKQNEHLFWNTLRWACTTVVCSVYRISCRYPSSIYRKLEHFTYSV